MSVGVDPCMSPTSGTLSCYVTTATAVAAAITFSASGAAPTPVRTENLNPHIMVMKPAKDRIRFDASSRLDRTGDRRKGV
jgi:hypothetical protein